MSDCLTLPRLILGSLADTCELLATTLILPGGMLTEKAMGK